MTTMKPSDVDRLLAAIRDERLTILSLVDTSVHFTAGALYALEKAEGVVMRINVEAPTCLIHCRQEEPT